jgi:hypothetical protein
VREILANSARLDMLERDTGLNTGGHGLGSCSRASTTRLGGVNVSGRPSDRSATIENVPRSADDPDVGAAKPASVVGPAGSARVSTPPIVSPVKVPTAASQVAGRVDTIPELAVVDMIREHNGRHELAVGVVLAADTDRDSYTVELVNTRGGKILVAASRRDLRVRHIV